MEERAKEMQEQERRIKIRMAKIKHKLAILSGKGGVGKSTIAANLAIALARKGYKVGVLDVDIHGPSIPKILGIRGRELATGPPGIFPAKGPLDIRVVSMDFLLPDDETPVIWRGPMKMGAIRQFLADVAWGNLDFLLIDLPPGTGDEPLSIMQLISDIDGILMITAPSEVSQIVVKRAIGFTRELRVPLVGVIENMSGFVCPKCGAEFDILGIGGGQKISEELGVPFLGKIPIDQRICEDSDRGTPFIIEHAETPAAKAFMQVVDKVEGYLKQRGTQA
ncbi:MAG: Mrp/NBP35 family ATP-binding protein [Candidatus Hadarchaeum sp.]|uniref:Mrp/NBP35 family ATP-binding protein n=1 Tax=Candidatus Hadarchaeum sp. TaxID=2883567 RepID=UPI003D0A2D3A